MISIVLTTYNRARLLPRAIDSVRAQTCLGWELIIIDDGSTDETLAVVDAYCASDARIRLLSQSNQGLSGGRNAGLAAATGQFVTFVDSDDAYEPDHLQLRLAYMMAHPDTDLIHGGLRIVGGPDCVPDRTKPGQMIAIADCFVGGTFFMRRAVATTLGGFRTPDFGNDYDFMTRALELFRVERVDYPTYVYYRDTPDSMCHVEALRDPES